MGMSSRGLHCSRPLRRCALLLCVLWFGLLVAAERAGGNARPVRIALGTGAGAKGHGGNFEAREIAGDYGDNGSDGDGGDYYYYHNGKYWYRPKGHAASLGADVLVSSGDDDDARSDSAVARLGRSARWIRRNPMWTAAGAGLAAVSGKWMYDRLAGERPIDPRPLPRSSPSGVARLEDDGEDEMEDEDNDEYDDEDEDESGGVAEERSVAGGVEQGIDELVDRLWTMAMKIQADFGGDSGVQRATAYLDRQVAELRARRPDWAAIERRIELESEFIRARILYSRTAETRFDGSTDITAVCLQYMRAYALGYNAVQARIQAREKMFIYLHLTKEEHINFAFWLRRGENADLASPLADLTSENHQTILEFLSRNAGFMGDKMILVLLPLLRFYEYQSTGDLVKAQECAMQFMTVSDDLKTRTKPQPIAQIRGLVRTATRKHVEDFVKTQIDMPNLRTLTDAVFDYSMADRDFCDLLLQRLMAANKYDTYDHFARKACQSKPPLALTPAISRACLIVSAERKQDRPALFEHYRAEEHEAAAAMLREMAVVKRDTYALETRSRFMQEAIILLVTADQMERAKGFIDEQRTLQEPVRQSKGKGRAFGSNK